ncbi:MAG: hypothetical protein U9Q83_10320, partial [Bacteroidota bacterium]|nr:hypothetical protein [Bacteroidota bacterium]
MQNKFISQETENYLYKLFYATNTSFLFDEAFPEMLNKKFPEKRFDSLIEIATKEFLDYENY